MKAVLHWLSAHSILAQRKLLVLFTLCAAIAGVLDGFNRFDNLLYDRILSATDTPAPKDVLIVMIDDSSIQELGYWPWRRWLHAELLDRLASARAVGLDIIFAEPSRAYPDDDALLADAIRRHGRVVLPVVLQQAHDALAPISPLASAAAGLGFINIKPDGDSVTRRVSLVETRQDKVTAHFLLALLRAGGDSAVADRAMAQALAAPDTPMLIPYSGDPGHFRSVPYQAVLRGEVSAEEIADHYVLVGPWATGLGDIFPTPVSHRSALSMSGVEIIANALQAVRQNKVLIQASAWQRALFTALPVLLLCLLLPRLSPAKTVLTCALLIAVVLASAVLLLHVGHVWLPPSAALLMLMLCYPIWNWRSQETVLRYLNAELHRLNREAPPELGGLHAADDSHSLEGRFTKLLHTLDRVRNLRRFLTDSLHGMPDATLLVDEQGHLKFFNHTAAEHFQRHGISSAELIDLPVEQVLACIVTDPNTRHTVIETIKTPSNSTMPSDSPWSIDLEVRDETDRFLLLKCAPIRTARNVLAGTIMTLTDITAIRTAERQREETMRFISHDMRAPQNSILALIELHRNRATPEQREALDRISLLAHRTLHLVDDFVDLSRAQSAALEPRIIDLADLLQNAVDELWAQAQQRHIRIHYAPPDTPVTILGDESLLLRALRNLIDNAVKYSPCDSQIRCTLAPTERYWEIRIIDQGPGIAPEDLEKIFKPFVRLNTDVTGTGLGLAFVRTVIVRHNGLISVTSPPGAGACFVLSLARASGTV